MYMKKVIITMLFASVTLGAMAQSTDSVCVRNDTLVCGERVNPSFRGGQKALTKYLQKNLQYPLLADEYGVEGKVIMTFFVERDGTLTDISAHDCRIERFNTTKFSQETEAKQMQLKEQFALLFAKEGARVIRKMPKWSPGHLNGETVRTKFNLTIHFYDPNK